MPLRTQPCKSRSRVDRRDPNSGTVSPRERLILWSHRVAHFFLVHSREPAAASKRRHLRKLLLETKPLRIPPPNGQFRRLPSPKMGFSFGFHLSWPWSLACHTETKQVRFFPPCFSVTGKKECQPQGTPKGPAKARGFSRRLPECPPWPTRWLSSLRAAALLILLTF